MRSVADQLRAEDRERMRALTPAERLQLSLRLGEADVVLYATARGLSRSEARACLQRRRQHGRIPSVCAER